MRFRGLAFGAVLAALSVCAAAADKVPESRHADTPLNAIVERDMLPQLDYLLARILTDKKDLVFDGVRAFSGQDKSLPGKIAIGLSHLLLETPRGDPRFEYYISGFRIVADLTVDDPDEVWGIHYYLSALNRLRKADLLDQAVSPETLAKLKTKLDWRGFVKVPEYTLIDLPADDYGVAFSIARLRLLLGWEDAEGSEKLLERMLEHYEKHSGPYGFSDETDGEGRFDRYSILLAGEICQRFIETDLMPPPQVKTWLRKSVDVLKLRLNDKGEGLEYGRNIGAYGDTTVIEVLSAAAYLDELTRDEKELAYAFAARVAERYAEFWYDPGMKSVNLWEHGRATDAYRGRHRILGENLSLLHQHIYTNDLWNELGFRNKRPTPRFEAMLSHLPRTTLTWFAKGEYDRALLTIRDGGHVIGLPLVNGGGTLHMTSPYFPIPFAHGLFSASPDAGYPQLVARFRLADGSELMPLAFFRDVSVSTFGPNLVHLAYRQEELDRIGAGVAIKDGRLRVATEYTFEPGRITRSDTYTPLLPIPVEGIRLEFATYSGRAKDEGRTVRFADGDVREFSLSGLSDCKVEAVDGRPPYRSPEGPFASLVTCQSGRQTLEKPFTLKWVVTYR